MATAVETPSQPRTPNPQPKLVVASLVGAAYVVAALAVVFYAVPMLWRENVSPHVGNAFVDFPLRIVAQIAAALALGWFGRSLAGANPPRGLRGGVFLMIVAALVIFFVVRWAGLAFDSSVGQVVAGVLGLVLLAGAFRLFTSPRGERWMVGAEEQGWFHAARYKPALGQRVRRLTMLGILLVGGSGVYSLMFQNVLPQDWNLALPFLDRTVTVLTDARYSIPLILLGLTLWFAFRAVNMPSFAEFLIATEAEMNKVSWTSRRRLVQDTIVVLVTTVLMTLFLLVVDIFWGWLLSRETVGVLPSKANAPAKGGQVQQAKW